MSNTLSRGSDAGVSAAAEPPAPQVVSDAEDEAAKQASRAAADEMAEHAHKARGCRTPRGSDVAMPVTIYRASHTLI